MKKIWMLILALLLMVGLACAGTKNLNFAWEQPGSLSGFSGWRLYQSNVAGGPGSLVMTIPYAGAQQTTYTGSKVLTSPDNETKTYFFTLSAFDVSNNESSRSNEVSVVIDFESPGVPTQFTVTITTP